MHHSKKVHRNGDRVNWTLEIKNNSTIVPCYNVQIDFSIPDGVMLTGPFNPENGMISVPYGFYRSYESIWYVGDMMPGDLIVANFEFTVNDLSMMDPNLHAFYVEAELDLSCDQQCKKRSTLIIEFEDDKPCQDPCTERSNLSIGFDSSGHHKIGGHGHGHHHGHHHHGNQGCCGKGHHHGGHHGHHHGHHHHPNLSIGHNKSKRQYTEFHYLD